MLTLFPALLTYKFYAPALLRAGAAGVFFYLARYHGAHRGEAAAEIAPLFSRRVAKAGLIVYIFAELVIGLGLLVGFLTQLAALLGLLVCIKILFVKRNLRALAPLERTSYLLVAVVCLSLLFTGAGAYAFDLPL